MTDGRYNNEARHRERAHARRGAVRALGHEAMSARAALAARGPYDIIIGDIGMPEVDGYTFMRSIGARDSGATVLAIALPAYAGAGDFRRAIRSGYHEHLAKPVDALVLLEA